MSKTITAIYENGVLRPTRPLALKEHQTVRLTIDIEQTISEQDEVLRLLETAGLFYRVNHDESPPPDPVSKEDRRNIAEKLGKKAGKSLSKLVLEDRDPR